MVFTDGNRLVAESLDELHKFAQRAGLKKDFYIDEKNCPHYDVTQNRVRVIDNGAQYTKDSRFLESILRRCAGTVDGS